MIWTSIPRWAPVFASHEWLWTLIHHFNHQSHVSTRTRLILIDIYSECRHACTSNLQNCVCMYSPPFHSYLYLWAFSSARDTLIKEQHYLRADALLAVRNAVSGAAIGFCLPFDTARTLPIAVNGAIVKHLVTRGSYDYVLQLYAFRDEPLMRWAIAPCDS